MLPNCLHQKTRRFFTFENMNFKINIYFRKDETI